MYANGTVINNCLSKETIKEYFPKPRASKTPDIKTPKDETIKLKDKILSPVSPISNMPLLALNKESKTFGTIKNNNVPAPKIAAMTKPAPDPCERSRGSGVFAENARERSANRAKSLTTAGI